MSLRILSLGAGVQSTAVYLLALDGKITPIDAAVFADTQEESDAVYRHLEWLQNLHGPAIYVRTAGKLGNDLQRGINSTGQRFVSIPAYTAPVGVRRAIGMVQRQCTQEYKIRVVERTIRRDILGLKPRARWPKDRPVVQLFGISTDEARRATSIQRRFKGIRTVDFPLLALGWTRGDCLRFLADRVPHPVPRSACVFCPFKSDAEWWLLQQTDPAGWRRAVEIDEAIREKSFARRMKQSLYLHRSARPLAEIEFEPKQHEFPGFALECEGGCGT